MSIFPKPKKSLACFIYCLVLSNALLAQKDSTHQKIYNVKVKWQLPASAACILLSNMGFRNLDKVSEMNAADILKLNPNDINSFDRPGAFLDPSEFESAQKRSDLFLNIALFTPAVLAFDKRIRKDWLDLITLYLVTHAVDNALYFAGTYSVRRPRPLTYNPGLTLDAKTGEGRSNSFFSGHTSFSAAATFFVARIYTDYHHITGWKRIGLYAAAAVPPSLVGYFRMEAGKHFKSDVIMGLIAGASSGILVPALHKFKKKHENISFAPFYTPGSSGLTVMVGL